MEGGLGGKTLGRRGPYEQVLEVGGGDVVLGLVGGEEAEVADHAVAAPQQVDPPADPFLPSKSERVRRRRNSADRGMAIGEGANLVEIRLKLPVTPRRSLLFSLQIPPPN
jgi:hypothetical protein